jgi:tetratricopeptide (TPR) repeat protein
LKIGRCCEKLKMFSEAFAFYKKSLDITKDYIWGLYYLGTLHIRTGRREEGLKFLRQAVDQSYENTEIVIRYCEELIKDNDNLDVAINVLTKTPELITENMDLMLILAKAYEKKDDNAKAIEVLEEAMMNKGFNSNPNKMFHLGLLYEKTMSFNKAIGIYKNILSINKDHIPSLCHLGGILSHAKEYKRAMKYFKYALSVDESLPFAHYGIGKIYQANNQIEEAMESYNKCLELDTKFYKYINVC